MSAPLIGLTLDSEEPGGYSKFPWYALRQNYCGAVAAAGGVPLPLPHEPDLVGRYLDLIDGLIVTGGAFDVDPALFGDASRHDTVKLKTARTEFEFALIRGAHQRDMPILGICGGEQLLNVVLGGTLVQHIPDDFPAGLAHEQANPRNEPGHDVVVTPDTLLHRIVGAGRLPVNSAHHQAIREPAPGCIVNAVAEDGVVEGIEDPTRRFCIGVQWHPEFAINPGDVRLHQALIAASAAA